MTTDDVALVTDSTAGIEALAPVSEWHVVPLELEIDGQRYREGPELSAGEFHRMLQEANGPPATLPPSVDTFAEVYGRLLERADRVLSLHLSGELSDTVDHARRAAERLGATTRVRIVDSRLAGAPLGLLCREAEARLGNGVEVEEAAASVEKLIERTSVYFSVYTLDYLYLGGRLERTPGAGVSHAEDRPILTMRDGRLELVERVIGETTRVERMVERVDERYGREEPLVAVCIHAGRRGEDAAHKLAERILSAPRGKETVWRFAPLGPVLCAHTGFDVCGIGAYPRGDSRL